MTKRDRLAIMAAILSVHKNLPPVINPIEAAWDLDVGVGRRLKQQADRMVNLGPGPDDFDPQDEPFVRRGPPLSCLDQIQKCWTVLSVSSASNGSVIDHDKTRRRLAFCCRFVDAQLFCQGCSVVGTVEHLLQQLFELVVAVELVEQVPE